jgi:hypothetical protein
MLENKIEKNRLKKGHKKRLESTQVNLSSVIQVLRRG